MSLLRKRVIETDRKSGKQMLDEVIQTLHDAGFHDNGKVVPGRYRIYLAIDEETKEKVGIFHFEDKIDFIMKGQDPLEACKLLATAFKED